MLTRQIQLLYPQFFGFDCVSRISKLLLYSFSSNGINQVIYKACLASIGNSMVLESKEKNYCDFKMISMLFMWLIGFCTTCFACLFQPFMEIWVRERFDAELFDGDSVLHLFLFM